LFQFFSIQFVCYVRVVKLDYVTTHQDQLSLLSLRVR